LETELAVIPVLRANPQAEEIQMYFDCPQGGSLTSAENLSCAISGHPAPTKVAIVTGSCHSATVAILMAFPVRLAALGASFYIHGTVADTQDAREASDAIASASGRE
jgi:ATP-dependent protease ClpP protease subunit